MKRYHAISVKILGFLNKNSAKQKSFIYTILFLGFLNFILLGTFVFITYFQPYIMAHSSKGGKVVLLRKDGFYPPSLKIKKGETVKFVTDQNKSFWPASDLHPNHLIYPEFDAKRAIQPGESWSFKFAKIGHFPYHNHLSPENKGLIEVVSDDGTKITEDFPLDCAKIKQTSMNEKCWTEKIKKIIKQNGIDAALEELALNYSSQPDVAGTCHALTHLIGEEAYTIFDKAQQFSVSNKTSYCGYGFYHGFFERLLHDKGDLKVAQRLCNYAGEKLKASAPDAQLQCYHGIGHGVFDYHTSNIKVSEQELLDPALSLCEQVSTTELQLSRCSTGVFNALALFYQSKNGQPLVDKNDPLRICRQQKEIFIEACIGNMNTLIYSITKDFNKGAKFIEKVNQDQYAKSGIRYLAAAYSSQYIKDIDGLGSQVAVCNNIQQRIHNECIEGLVHGLLEMGEPNKEYENALKFCQTKLSDYEDNLTCIKYVLSFLGSIYPKEKIEKICTDLDPNYRQYCFVDQSVN